MPRKPTGFCQNGHPRPNTYDGCLICRREKHDALMSEGKCKDCKKPDPDIGHGKDQFSRCKGCRGKQAARAAEKRGSKKVSSPEHGNSYEQRSLRPLAPAGSAGAHQYTSPAQTDFHSTYPSGSGHEFSSRALGASPSLSRSASLWSGHHPQMSPLQTGSQADSSSPFGPTQRSLPPLTPSRSAGAHQYMSPAQTDFRSVYTSGSGRELSFPPLGASSYLGHSAPSVGGSHAPTSPSQTGSQVDSSSLFGPAQRSLPPPFHGYTDYAYDDVDDDSAPQGHYSHQQ
jgi:hypothetical protein